MPKSLSFSLLLLFVFFVGKVSGQTISILQWMQQDKAVDLYLTLDWKEIQKKKEDKAYMPASVLLKKENGDTMHLELKCKTRGHMRLDICSYPPLKLKFPKSELTKRSLLEMNEVDLVHPCQNGDAYDQYLLREYLAYKLYQLVSPVAYNVQLVNIHYENPDHTEAFESTLGFLVENEEELVMRLKGRSSQVAVMSERAIDHGAFLRVTLFEFMIGNTDWYIQTRHNLDFIVVPGYNLMVPVPYDFDYSGLVGAPYAAHHETLKLPTVVTRYYQGWCETEEDVNNMLKVFIDNKEKILAMPAEIQGMSERSVEYARSYLEEFFTIIENPKKLQNNIIKHCDMWPVQE